MKRLLLPLLASLSLAACSSLPMGPAPTAAETAKLPVITLGQQPLPPGDAYVLYFPAGTPLPIRTDVDGSAFAQSGESTLHVTLKRGIYGYRQYASFDQKTWVPWNQMLATQFHLHIPGKDGKNAAVLHLQMDLR